MARTPRKTPGTDIVDWEAELAAQADIAAAAQRSLGAGGKFFSMKAGQLTFDGNTMPGNMMAVVVLAYTLENSYYEGEYDPDTPTAPTCFAFGLDEHTLEAHEAVDNDPYFTRQHDQCAGCPQNEWGSARTGRGKACANRVRLCVIPAGEYKLKGGRGGGVEYEPFDDPDMFASSEPAFLKLPVMSVRNWTSYVKQVAADIRRPPHGVITNVVVEPDAKSQFKVTFELIDNLPNDLLKIVMPRHKKEQEAVAFPYTPPAERDGPALPPAKANNKLTRQPAAATTRRR